MPPPIVIKKYANRRLYDTEKSRYITLSEVAERIKKGGDVKVVDAKSGEDVTAFILTQVILETGRTRNVLLPPPLLHLLIRYGDTTLSGFFETYLEQMVTSYLLSKQTADAQFRRWLAMGTELSERTRRTLTEMGGFPSFFSPPKGEAPAGKQTEEPAEKTPKTD